MTGKVRNYGKRGFGFITGDDGGDYFVHQSSILMDGFRYLKVGDIVSFDIGVNEQNGKVKAVNCKKIEAVGGIITEALVSVGGKLIETGVII